MTDPLYVAGARGQHRGHQGNARQYLTTEVLTVSIQDIDGHCGARINDYASCLNFRPGANHGDPAIDAHASWLPVAVANATGLSFCFREVNIALAVHSDDA